MVPDLRARTGLPIGRPPSPRSHERRPTPPPWRRTEALRPFDVRHRALDASL